MMKLLLMVVSLGALINGLSHDVVEKFKEEIKGHVDECKDEVGATSADVQQFFNHIVPVTHSGKCLVACVGKKIEWLDESGQIDEEKIRGCVEKFKEMDEELYEKMHTIMEKCLDHIHNEDNECDTAANLFSCINRGKRIAGIDKIFDD